MGELAMKEEASIRNNLRVSVKLLSQRYLSTMKAIWIGVTLPLPKDSGFLDLDCLAIVVWFWFLRFVFCEVCLVYLFRVCEKLKRVKKEGRKCGCERRERVFLGFRLKFIDCFGGNNKTERCLPRGVTFFSFLFVFDSFTIFFNCENNIIYKMRKRG